MNDNEVNKIIAEFMGVPWCPCNDGFKVEAHDLHPKYTESLDALVPVWDKLGGKTGIDITIQNDGIDCLEKYQVKLDSDFIVESSWYKTIQQAAAHATAKAILEITK